mmetsp:Transcript_7239/g.16469  ORF Transcript_7239/g.16469 Transcript_7239/m.16469 type:complete len:123 (-) Transcript_7239:104-472(-)
MCSIGECCGCCAGFSVSGVVFMIFVAMLLKYQPFFIVGIDDYKHSKEAAFKAMWAFIFTFGVSLVILVRDSRRKRFQTLLDRQTYEQLRAPDLAGLEELDNDGRDEGRVPDLPLSVSEGVYA